MQYSKHSSEGIRECIRNLASLGAGYLIQLTLNNDDWELSRKFGDLLTGETQ